MVLIKTTTLPGAFDQCVLEAMGAGTAQPLILPLSNPRALAEARPADLLHWSRGLGLVASGIPLTLSQPLMTGLSKGSSVFLAVAAEHRRWSSLWFR